uniref:Transmembrane protein 220 n=1 Tax=Maylandia zebra TaxID=106582 RepID=A0A3P9AS79_9CICH
MAAARTRLINRIRRLVSYVAAELYSCISPVHVAPPCGCILTTLPWRRVADLHVLISSAISAMLGWTLYKEQITQIFQKEEGREFSGLVLTAIWLLLCRHSGRAPVGILRVSTAAAITVFPFVAWLYYHINKDLRSDWPSHCTTAI